MKNIYEKIDTMFSGTDDDKPKWAIDILNELHDIKKLLEDVEPQKNIYSSITDNHQFTKYEFIQDIRNNYNDSVSTKDILWKNQRLGIKECGLIYNKRNNRIYSTEEAKIIYEELYNLSLNSV